MTGFLITSAVTTSAELMYRGKLCILRKREVQDAPLALLSCSLSLGKSQLKYGNPWDGLLLRLFWSCCALCDKDILLIFDLFDKDILLIPDIAGRGLL